MKKKTNKLKKKDLKTIKHLRTKKHPRTKKHLRTKKHQKTRRINKYAKGFPSLQKLTAKKLVEVGLTSEMLQRNKYPDEIIQHILNIEHTEIKKKKKAMMNELKEKDKLKKKFQKKIKHNRDEHESIDPYDAEFSELIKSASEILNKKDGKKKFWKNLLGNIYNKLIEYEYQGGRNSNNYDNSVYYFKILVKNLYDIDMSDDDLENDELYHLFEEE